MKSFHIISVIWVVVVLTLYFFGDAQKMNSTGEMLLLLYSVCIFWIWQSDQGKLHFLGYRKGKRATRPQKDDYINSIIEIYNLIMQNSKVLSSYSANINDLIKKGLVNTFILEEDGEFYKIHKYIDFKNIQDGVSGPSQIFYKDAFFEDIVNVKNVKSHVALLLRQSIVIQDNKLSIRQLNQERCVKLLLEKIDSRSIPPVEFVNNALYVFNLKYDHDLCIPPWPGGC
ncbi:hypothetical protein [Oceanidesulfovibrio marinus]|uniref:Uncharacterized protein n=1 Tax=Oceanidesulfovibrio marinus TaxID=370038 RepID=A0ABX6NCZ1_9BACT|nr:hypothetical protein [Oceanidesulfovibrio marinus]QJT08049.1 hypothetical protein E8L03_03520 [Oceanidesulfovibrio marinus]